MRTRKKTASSRQKAKRSKLPLLSSIQPVDIEAEILQNPRRMAELMRLLGSNAIALRGRAAAALALLSDSHPERLLRVVGRMRDALDDDAAYVRWNIVYALGRMGSRYPGQSSMFLSDLSERLDDDNRIVRHLACRALARLASHSPRDVENLFASGQREIPSAVARILRKRSGAR